MKKILALLMCFALVFSLAACSNDNGGNADANETPDASVVDSTNDAKDEPVAKTPSRGTVEGDVYTNDFIGITFTKGADWTFLTDEEIAERTNTSLDVFDYNSVQEALAKTATMHDMFVVDQNGNNVNIIFENTMLTAMKKLTIDEYVTALQAQFDNLEGYEYEILSREEVTLGDASFTKLTSILTIGEQAVNQACYIKIADQYVTTITVTPTTETIDSIEAMFS